MNFHEADGRHIVAHMAKMERQLLDVDQSYLQKINDVV